LQNCNEAVHDAQIGATLARAQASKAISEDENLLRQLALAKKMLDESVAKPAALANEVDSLTNQQDATKRKRDAACKILEDTERKLREAKDPVAAAQQEVTRIEAERDEITLEIARHRSVPIA